MQALWCREFGPVEDLTVEDVDIREPEADEVRIRVMAAGVSFATSLVVTGRYQRKPPLPFAPGTEVAGVIDAVGPEVSRFVPGDRVYAGIDWGGQAEFALTRALSVQPMPDGMDFPEATAFALSYPTSAGALLWTAGLKANETLLVHAGAGAVGMSSIQIGKALGARVLATAGGPEKRDFALAQGADMAFDYLAEDFRAAVREATGGRGVDVVVDPVGGDVTRESLRCLVRGGRLIVIGFASGTIPEVPANLLLLKNASLIGFNLGEYIGWGLVDEREAYADDMALLHARLADWYRAGLLNPVVGGRFPLSGFHDALAMVLERRALGKVVTQPGDG
jgi:NADPH2:quinone reductase